MCFDLITILDHLFLVSKFWSMCLTLFAIEIFFITLYMIENRKTQKLEAPNYIIGNIYD